MRKEMFYGASHLIFQKAEELRNCSTPAEELLWNHLKGSQLGVKFRRQHPAAIYVLDFYCYEAQLALELNGSIHQLEEVKKNDVIRENTLKTLGIKVIRFNNQEVISNVNKVIDKINLAITSANQIINLLKVPL